MLPKLNEAERIALRLASEGAVTNAQSLADWPILARAFAQIGFDDLPSSTPGCVIRGLALIACTLLSLPSQFEAAIADHALGRTHWSGCTLARPCCRCRAEAAEMALLGDFRVGPAS